MHQGAGADSGVGAGAGSFRWARRFPHRARLLQAVSKM